MDPIFEKQTEGILLNGAVYHAKCYSFFKDSNFKRAEKSLTILQFYREFGLDIDDILKNFRSMDGENLKPNEKKVMHPADRLVLKI